MPHRPTRPGPTGRGPTARRSVRHGAGTSAQRLRRTVAQAVTVLAVGGLTAGLLLHGTGAPPASDAASTHRDATSTSDDRADAPVTRAGDQGDPRALLAPAAPRTGPPLIDPEGTGTAGDRRAATEALDLPTAPGTTPIPPPAAAFDLGRYSTSDPASPWVVVNKALPLVPADHAPTDLVVVAGYEVRAEVADPLARMLAAAAADGVAVELRSGFRSAQYQDGVHAGWASRLGDARADEVSARAGHSEHQTGLAVDVGSGSDPACDFEACFDATAEGAWVAARAGEFGFLVRYTVANQAVTGYAPEGWHLRYVGVDLVGEMRQRGVTTLEELFGLPGGATYR